MNVTQAIKMAAKSIFSNKARSALTMLGIIIGLAAVIILVSFAEGQNLAMKEYYESMGTNKVEVYAYSWDPSLDVSKSLYDYCLKLDDLVLGVTPYGRIWNDITIKYGAKTLSRDRGGNGGGSAIIMGGGGGGGGGGQEDTYPEIILANDQFGIANDYTLSAGRELSFLDVEKEAKVCVLGAATAEALFAFANPIDQTITMNGISFRVVGVYESKAGRGAPTSEQDYYMKESMKRLDKLIVVPSTMTRLFNDNQPIDQFIVKAKDSQSTKEVITLLNGFLLNLIGDPNEQNTQGDFGVGSNDGRQDDQSEATKLQQQFLGGIAAISLLVGGIGIMNIMLVTVTERTREIGIRKAIGAERSSIIVQFLIEAAMICGMGGIVGIAVGYTGTLIVGKISFNIILIPSTGVTAGAAIISIALGIIFGLYPAIKASGLQPVVALRAD